MNKIISLSKSKKRILIIGIAFVLLLLAAGYTVFIAPLLNQEKWIYKEAAVEKGSLIVGVKESGSLQYGIESIEYDLDLEVGEDDSDEEDADDEDEEDTVQKYLKIEDIYVAPGQRIASGDMMLKFTEDSVSAVRKLLEKARIDAQVAYNEAETEYNLSVLEKSTDYETERVEQNYANTIYKSAQNTIDNSISAMEVEINQRNSNITTLEEKAKEAQENYQEALTTYEGAQDAMALTGVDDTANFLVIQKVYVNAKNTFISAKDKLEQAEEQIAENATQIARLQSKLEAAQKKRTIEHLDVKQAYQESVITGENAQITYTASLESLKEELQEAEEDKKTVEKQVKAFEEFVGEGGALYADKAGIITELGFEAGDTLKTTGNVVSYATPSDMTLSIDMTQEDVVALSVGDTVEIIFNAYEDTVYEGTILSIDTTATSRDSATISYTVVIGVEGDTEKLFGGMTADITFVTNEKEDVLYLSKKAIVEQNGKSYVYVKTALGGRQLKAVETGISNGINIEIISGLEEGDTIYIASRVSSESEVENTGGVDENNNKNP